VPCSADFLAENVDAYFTHTVWFGCYFVFVFKYNNEFLVNASATAVYVPSRRA